MGEESNLEKRLIFLGTVSVPAFEPVMVANPWEHEVKNVSEPIGKLKDIFKTDDVSFTCTLEPNNMKTIRKLLGLPEVPLSKVKRRRKSFKKALMAYGYSRNAAERICGLIAISNSTVSCIRPNSYADCCEHMITFRGR